VLAGYSFEGGGRVCSGKIGRPYTFAKLEIIVYTRTLGEKFISKKRGGVGSRKKKKKAVSKKITSGERVWQGGWWEVFTLHRMQKKRTWTDS